MSAQDKDPAKAAASAARASTATAQGAAPTGKGPTEAGPQGPGARAPMSDAPSKQDPSKESTHGVTYDARLVRRLWQYIRPHRKWLGLALVLMLVTSACGLAKPLLLRLRK